MVDHEENDIEVDPKDVVISRLQSTISMMSAPHPTNGDKKEPYCIYCGTPFPCMTSRLARRSATAWRGLE
jgi:hypothetical protein